MANQRYRDESDYNRIMRKKALKRKKKRRRLIAALILWVVFVAVFSSVIYLGYKLVANLVDSSNDKKVFIELAPDDRNIELVDNYLIKEVFDKTDFFEVSHSIEDKEKDTEKDPDSYLYDGVVPGSRGLVIIDAGHGGYDGGAVANGVTEKDVNLSIAYWLKDELTRRGYSIYMTRTDDDFVGLTTRANRANAQDNPVCLISVHQNSIDESSSVHGVEAWTYKREGCTELGDAVCDGVSKRTGAQNRGTNYRTNLVVTSKTTMPAVIVECGYLTNPEEAEMLSEDDYQIKIAKGIADGIDTFSK